MLVVALLVVGCTTGGDAPGGAGGAASRSDGTGERAGTLPGERFDGSDLPTPVSSLATIDGLVAYFTAGPDDHLELVAIDPDEAEVVWTRPAAMPLQPHGVAIALEVIDGALAIFGPNEPGTPHGLELIEGDGQVRWRREITEPTSQPEACADRVCVETHDGPVAFDAASGERHEGRRLDERIQIVGSDGDATLGVVFPGTVDTPLRELVGLPRPGSDGGWRRPISDIFGTDQVTITSYGGYRFGEAWVLDLGHVLPFPEDEMPDFPYEPPPGSVASFLVDDGSPRWHRPGASICWSDAVTAESLVLCYPEVRFPSEDEWGIALIDRFEVVDIETGTTLDEVALDQSIDVYDPDRSPLDLGGGRWALPDGPRTVVIDLEAETVSEGDPEVLGWCRFGTVVDEVVDPFGDLVSYGDPGYLRPCDLGRGEAEDDAISALVDGDIALPDANTVVETGGWLLWVDDGRLSGVAVLQ